MNRKQGFKKFLGVLLSVGLLSAALAAETSAASRYDGQLQNAVTQKLASKNQYNNVKATVEDGIVTLTGNVDLYQRKLDAAKLARKIPNAQGVRNLITVAGANVPDEQLEQKLATKLTYVREGYDSTFDYFALGVKDGVVTLEGDDRTGVKLRRRLTPACGPRHLRRSGAAQVCHRSGASHPHYRRQWSRHARRCREQHDGQADRRNASRSTLRRLQRRKQTGSGEGLIDAGADSALP